MNLAKLVFRLILGRRLPTVSGELQVPGLEGPVMIRRDRYGIAYIEADTDADAWYGLGFCHGQDRAFQLETLSRAVRGTLSEMVGPAVLPVDRLSRRIGFFRSAKEQMAVLDADIQRTLEAYALGATAGMQQGCRRKAHEFALLRAVPAQYEATDALGVIKLFSFTVSTNWDLELARLRVITEDGSEALKALDPAYPEWLPVVSPPGEAAGPATDRLAADLAIFASTVGLGGASNSWAVAPFRTATGRPILANDPHLPPVLPPYWYLARIRTPQWSMAGASGVGTPLFPAGHNGTAAWGLTAGCVDNTDLFIEKVGEDGRSVLHGDHFLPCPVRTEVIHVKAQAPVTEKVMETPRGPIIGPALEGDAGAISMRATWLDPRPIRGLFQVHQVRSFEEFRRAFEQWPVLPLNMVYADTSGKIGWQLVGEAPVRRKGWGTLPLAGWDPEVGWEQELVPFDAMPHLSDPPHGFVATSNNQPTSEVCGPFLGVDWIDGYRAMRITEALRSRKGWDLPGTKALQLDQKALPWLELRDAVLALSAEAEGARLGLDLLKAWDGVASADSPAATVFEFFMAEMVRRAANAKAPRSAQWSLSKGFTPLVPHTLFAVRRAGHLVRLVREQPDGWFARSWPQEMADALDKAVVTLRAQYGRDPKKWRWGRVRPLTFRHRVGDNGPLNRVFNLGPYSWGGDANTVGQAATDPVAPASNPLFVASLRMVLDVGNWDESRFSLPGGQSGNPMSPHYDDLLPLWRRGEGVPIAWSHDQIVQQSRDLLRLLPEAS